MKKKIILLMVSLFFALAGIANATDIQQGVLKYNWGTQASQYPDLKQVSEQGEVSYYSNSGEIYQIGDISVNKIVYGFYKNQLFGVYININSIAIYDKLLKHMKSEYGLPATKITASGLETSKWKRDDVTIKLKMDKLTQKMKIAFYYRPLSKTLRAQQVDDLDTSSFNFLAFEKDDNPKKFVLFEF